MENNRTFRWGILGPGAIARKFAADLAHCSSPARLDAVGSRSLARATNFGAEFGAGRCYGSYEELAADDELDAIYIATPHSEHARNALLCLQHGKSVLVEKPFTLNAGEVEQVIQSARERRLFCMEGMWTRFFPTTRKLCQLIESGRIGPVRMVMADFGYRTRYDAESRLFNPSLGGGGLMDVGIYPLSLACMVLGEPVAIAAQASHAPTAVDDSAAVLLRHKGNELSLLSCATQVRTPQQAIVLGEEGSISLHPDWWRPGGLTVLRDGEVVEVIELPFSGTGFQFEADEARACILSGKLESELMPLDETLMLMRTLDATRAQVGVAYPGEMQSVKSVSTPT